MHFLTVLVRLLLMISIIQDFIIFRLTPPNTIRSDLLETQLTIPIKIVTDSYEALDPEYFESQ